MTKNRQKRRDKNRLNSNQTVHMSVENYCGLFDEEGILFVYRERRERERDMDSRDELGAQLMRGRVHSQGRVEI